MKNRVKCEVMPFEIKNHGDYLLTRFFGAVTAAELERFAHEAARNEDALRVSINRVTDLTDVTSFDANFPDMWTLAKRRRAREFQKDLKSAIVVNAPLTMGFARMFQTLNDHPQLEIRIVSRMEDALAWFADGSPPVTRRPPAK